MGGEAGEPQAASARLVLPPTSGHGPKEEQKQGKGYLGPGKALQAPRGPHQPASTPVHAHRHTATATLAATHTHTHTHSMHTEGFEGPGPTPRTLECLWIGIQSGRSLAGGTAAGVGLRHGY